MNKKKTFRLLLIAQSLSAFADNAVYSVIMGMLLSLVTSHEISVERFGVYSAIYANCLFLPYVLFAPFLGWLSDRYTKKNILITANLIKFIGCLIGFFTVLSGKNSMMASYLMIGVGAAIYSPSKYGIIPELKKEEELVKANASMEMTTIFSILLGIIAGGILVDNIGAKTSFIVLLAVYLSAAFFNLLMDNTNVFHKDEVLSKALVDFKFTLKSVFKNKYLYVPVLGTAIFWASASFIKLNLQTWGQDTVKLCTATDISMLSLWLSLGIIAGSFVAGKKFKTGQIAQTWIVGLLMGLVIIITASKFFNYYLLAIELIVIGTLGGIFLIPLNAAIQSKSDLRNIGKVIAIQNFLENVAMLFCVGFFMYLNKINISCTATFLAIGGILCLVNVLWLRPFLKRL